MSGRFTAVVMLLLAVTFILAGCGGPDDNSPEGVVKRFFERLDDQDEDAVRALLCEDYRQNVNFSRGPDEEIELDFDVELSGEGSADASGDTADVLVSGKIERGLRTEDVRHLLRIQRDDAAPWTVKTFKVDGEWLVCGGDAFIVSLLDSRAAFDGIE